MARIQQRRTGRQVRPDKVGVLAMKQALSKWSHEKEYVPPPKFGELKRKNSTGGS